MQSMGPYYSHTLLNAMLSHSIRWGKSDPSTRRILDESYESGAVFGKHARSMVFEELSKGTITVPTVQTLLLLSAQECGFGNAAQAWTYSGLAFRLIEHLGITVDNDNYVGSVPLSDEEIEIRHRLFWSCYFWDKMISLYLGRAPTIKHTTVSPPHVLRKWPCCLNMFSVTDPVQWLTIQRRVTFGCLLALVLAKIGTTPLRQRTPHLVSLACASLLSSLTKFSFTCMTPR